MVYVDRRGLFMNGKAEAASGAPTCEKRVNTFSFCGTGGSFFTYLQTVRALKIFHFLSPMIRLENATILNRPRPVALRTDRVDPYFISRKF